jgi:hypothetical protein
MIDRDDRGKYGSRLRQLNTAEGVRTRVSGSDFLLLHNSPCEFDSTGINRPPSCVACVPPCVYVCVCVCVCVMQLCGMK